MELLDSGSARTTAGLSFYAAAPSTAIALDEFERAGLLRLKVLRALAAWQPGVDRELHARMRRDLETMDEFQELVGDEALDTMSHYALRLAFRKYVVYQASVLSCESRSSLRRVDVFCRKKDLVEWLVDIETKLFGFRVFTLPSDAGVATAILSREGIKYPTARISSLSPAERRWLTHGHSAQDRDQEVVYKVPFAEIPSLVKRRRILVKRGICLVRGRDIVYVALHHFRISLEQQLKVLQRASHANQESSLERLEPILELFIAKSRDQCSSTFSQRSEQPRIVAGNIDSMAEQHFPLCMKNLHRRFREDHHLKYDGRVQYRMFLKGMGWSVHDTLLFFRNEFVQVISAARFDREYAYHIRHSYGLEGARKDYAPLDCGQIIHGSAPRHGQYHGCPFRHWNGNHLNAELRRQSGMSVAVASQISAQAASGNVRGACELFFDASHRCSYSEAVRRSGSSHPQHRTQTASATSAVYHPNAWLDASLHSL